MLLFCFYQQTATTTKIVILYTILVCNAWALIFRELKAKKNSKIQNGGLNQNDRNFGRKKNCLAKKFKIAVFLQNVLSVFDVFLKS
jgi:hypothetical protein